MKKTIYLIDEKVVGSDLITTDEFEKEKEALYQWNHLKDYSINAKRGNVDKEYTLTKWTFETDEDGEPLNDGVFDEVDHFITDKIL